MTVLTRNTYYFEDLQLGMEATFAKTVTEADINGFADVTGDKNPVHLDEAFAAKTMFKTRIAHGMLTASYISAVFGMELPGPGRHLHFANAELPRPREDRRQGDRQGQGRRAFPGQAPRALRLRLHGRRQGRA